MRFVHIGILALLLIPPVFADENPWIKRAPALIDAARESKSVSALLAGLDAARRADDWQAGLTLAEQAQAAFPNHTELCAAVTRALWRGGRLEEALRLAGSGCCDASDPACAAVQLILAMAAPGGQANAQRLAATLSAATRREVLDSAVLFGYELQAGRLAQAAKLAREITSQADPSQGYPHNYLKESISGIAQFLEQVGDGPLNRVTGHGDAVMSRLAVINLPSVDVTINGKGPFRLIVDTGGSIALSLDTEAAEAAGLKSLAQASVRGVSGTDTSGQALIERVEIGEIVCERVMARIFAVRAATANTADGILGTGVFARERVQFDFDAGVLRVSPSSEKPAPGKEVPLWSVGDEKLLVPIGLRGAPGVMLLDTGADTVVISPTTLKRLHPDANLPELPVGGMGVGQGSTTRLQLGPGVGLTFAGRELEDVGGLALGMLDDVLSPIIGVQVDVLAGMGIFREMRSFTIDYGRRRLWVDWLAP